MNTAYFNEQKADEQAKELRKYLKGLSSSVLESDENVEPMEKNIDQILTAANAVTWTDILSEQDLELVWNGIISLCFSAQLEGSLLRPLLIKLADILAATSLTSIDDKHFTVRSTLLAVLLHSEAVSNDSQSPTLRYEVFLRLLRMCARLQASGGSTRGVPFVQRLPSIIPVTVPAVTRFLAESNCTPKQSYEVWLALHEALCGSDANAQPAGIAGSGDRQRQSSTSVVPTAPAGETLTAATREMALATLYEALATFSSASDDEARSAAGPIACRLLVSALNEPSTLLLDEVAALKPIKLIDDPAFHKLMEIYKSGTYSDYMIFYEANKEFFSKHGIDHAAQQRKLRLLTLMQLAEKHVSQRVAFGDIERALQIAPELVEPFLVECVRERALICRIDDVSRAVTVESTLLQREFGRAQWAEIAERVRRWGAGVAGVSKQLDDALAKPPSQAAAALAVSALAPPPLPPAGSHKAGPSGRR